MVACAVFLDTDNPAIDEFDHACRFIAGNQIGNEFSQVRQMPDKHRVVFFQAGCECHNRIIGVHPRYFEYFPIPDLPCQDLSGFLSPCFAAVADSID